MGVIVRLSDYRADGSPRLVSGHVGFDRVTSGLRIGATCLLKGPKGSGKSTLAMQVAGGVAIRLRRASLYASGEETGEEVKGRALAVGVDPRAIAFCEKPDLSLVGREIVRRRFRFVVLDSLQVMEFSGLSRLSWERRAQVFEKFCEWLKRRRCAALVLSHVNAAQRVKGGPTFEHAPNVNLALEVQAGDVRFLWAEKNRGGPAGRLAGIRLWMTGQGLVVRG